jgi:homoserine dehydrogenase
MPSARRGKEQAIRTYKLCLLGFGNVNRALVSLLQQKDEWLRDRGIGWNICGVASRRLGWVANPEGCDPAKLQDLNPENSGGSGELADDLQDWLRRSRPDVVFEATSLDPDTGQPAIDYIRAALHAGAHAITANKGPVVHAYRELQALAEVQKRFFRFEATVMDGVPIFSLFRESLAAVELKSLRGILNSTTNVVLSGMEEGLSFEDALAQAQKIGVAETDASHDIDGWDAAVKVAALVNVLMGIRLRIEEVQREGIRGLTGEKVRAALNRGCRYKLVCRAGRDGNSVTASVRPEILPISDPLAGVSGTSSIVSFETDIFPGLTITEFNPGVQATAYGMLSDLIGIADREKSSSALATEQEQ